MLNMESNFFKKSIIFTFNVDNTHDIHDFLNIFNQNLFVYNKKIRKLIFILEIK